MTLSAESYLIETIIQDEGPPNTTMFTQTVVIGTILLDEPSSLDTMPVTIVGPTKYVGTNTAHNYLLPRPGINNADPHCNDMDQHPKNIYPNRYVTMTTQSLVLTDKRTVTTVCQTFTGPTTVSDTTVIDLILYTADSPRLGQVYGGIVASVSFISLLFLCITSQSLRPTLLA